MPTTPARASYSYACYYASLSTGRGSRCMRA